MEGNLACTGVVGVILVMVGLWVSWGVLKDWTRYRKSENWLSVTGQVTESYVKEQVGDDGASYTPVIIYTYQVMGQTYQGSLISFGAEKLSYERHKKAQKVVERHAVGSQPVIHYDPDDPSQAVLERKFNAQGAVLGFCVLVFGGWSVYAAYFQ